MVLDASALLAFFQGEPGQDVVAAELARGAAMSAVNVTEVVGKLVGAGQAPEPNVRGDLLDLGLDIVPLDTELALQAGFFYARRHPYRLSLGDCACLALAEARGHDVLTGEQGWARLQDLRIGVRLIR